MVRGVSLGPGFWVGNTWKVLLQKQLQRSVLKFPPIFLTDCCTQKNVSVFSNKSHSFFIAIIGRVLKAFLHEHNWWDYSKKNWKSKIAGMLLFVSWLAERYQWKNNYWKPRVRAHKVGKIVNFWSNFDPNSPNIRRVGKKENYFGKG